MQRLEVGQHLCFVAAFLFVCLFVLSIQSLFVWRKEGEINGGEQCSKFLSLSVCTIGKVPGSHGYICF